MNGRVERGSTTRDRCYILGRPVGLPSGTLFGPYRILAALGVGGMGEVYKALDTRLDRTVAIKVLPADLRVDAQVRQRFAREARSVAALSHPHICPLFDVGQHDGTDFLVMEFLEGETLAAVLARGKLPLDRVLTYADQIAAALGAAHMAGIVHRDLKPGNIMITKAGAKLLDFGVAKLRQEEAFSSEGQTATGRGLTGVGTLVGTLQYMAPEQLDRFEADARTDIFAFGAVLYEMLTGHSPHQAPSTAGVVAAIMREPAPSARREIPDVPPLVDTVVRKCLEKVPDRRWQSIEAVREALRWAAEIPVADVSVPPARPRRSRTVMLLVLTVGLTASAWFLSRLSIVPAPPPLVRSDIDLPRAVDFAHDSYFAVSPDGRWLAIAAGGGLWLRSLEDGTIRQLPGAASAESPFWSPDSTAIGFFAEGKLKTLLLPDGVPAIVADAPNARGGAWSASGFIVYAPAAQGALIKVPARGGEVTPVTALDGTREEDSHAEPFFLQDARRFTYFAQSRKPSRSAIKIGSLDGAAATGSIVMAGVESGAAYVDDSRGGPAYLLYVRNHELLVQRFEQRTGALSGEPAALATRLRRSGIGAGFSASAAGLLLYAAQAPLRHQPRWVGRTGQLLGLVGPSGRYDTISLSPEHRKFVAGRAVDEAGTNGIWMFDLDRNLDSRLPLDGRASSGIWAPDGERVVVAWTRGAEQSNLYVLDLGGREEPRSVLAPGPSRWPLDWSRDGEFLLFAQVEPATRFDIWAVRMTGVDRTPIPVVRGPGKDNEARFSPDGRFIAFQADDSGETRVYVMRFQPDRGRRVLVSSGEGAEPRWRDDGRELYYISKDRSLMAVSFETRGDDLVPGPPERLFGGPGGDPVWHFEPDVRGERFLVLPLAEDPGMTPLHLLTGFQRSAR